jgi:hypothetical protein
MLELKKITYLSSKGEKDMDNRLKKKITNFGKK